MPQSVWLPQDYHKQRFRADTDENSGAVLAVYNGEAVGEQFQMGITLSP